MTSQTKAQFEASLDNISGPLLSGTFLEFYNEQREAVLTHRCTLSTNIDEYLVLPKAGKITQIYSVINKTIDTGNETIVFKNGSDTLGTITVAFSGSQAGDVDSLTPSANNVFAAGEALLIELGGESGQAPQCDLTILYQIGAS